MRFVLDAQLTATGCALLTRGMPVKTDEIKALMQGVMAIARRLTGPTKTAATPAFAGG